MGNYAAMQHIVQDAIGTHSSAYAAASASMAWRARSINRRGEKGSSDCGFLPVNNQSVKS